MNTKTLSKWAIGCLVLLILPVYAAPETYQLDTVHSMVFFKIKHQDAGYTYGMFFNPDGQFVWDADNPSNNSVSVQIKAEAINTGNTNRDNHLRGPDFLNARQFRMIEFKSTSVKKTGDKTFEALGKLTLHGVTKDITVQFEQTGQAESRGRSIMGFEGKFKVKRSEFGMDRMIGSVGDEIHLMVTLEGVKQ